MKVAQVAAVGVGGAVQAVSRQAALGRVVAGESSRLPRGAARAVETSPAGVQLSSRGHQLLDVTTT